MAVTFLAIFGIVTLSLFSAYQIGYKDGVARGEQQGLIIGANVLAFKLCEQNNTFMCGSNRACGCFSISEFEQGGN